MENLPVTIMVQAQALGLTAQQRAFYCCFSVDCEPVELNGLFRHLGPKTHSPQAGLLITQRLTGVMEASAMELISKNKRIQKRERI